MTPTLIAFLIIVFFILVSLALLYKSKVHGEISIFGAKIKIKASGNPKQGSARTSRAGATSNEVDIQGTMDEVEIEQVAGRDINRHNEPDAKTSFGNSRVVIDGNLKNVKLNQVAGRDISVPASHSKPKSKQSKGK